MAKFNIRSIAIKWYFFSTSSYTVYNEFSHVFMKQFGLTSKQIGISNLFGVQHLFIPLILYFGDRFRARSLVIWIASILSVLICLLPLLPLVVSLPTCFQTELESNKSGMCLYCLNLLEYHNNIAISLNKGFTHA